MEPAANFALNEKKLVKFTGCLKLLPWAVDQMIDGVRPCGT
jgi:hypothetical protein